MPYIKETFIPLVYIYRLCLYRPKTSQVGLAHEVFHIIVCLNVKKYCHVCCIAATINICFILFFNISCYSRNINTSSVKLLTVKLCGVQIDRQMDSGVLYFNTL